MFVDDPRAVGPLMDLIGNGNPAPLGDPWDRVHGNLGRGRPVVIVDDGPDSDDADLVLAAELCTAESLAFMVRNTSGLIWAAMTISDARRLQLPPMTTANERFQGQAWSVSADAVEGTTTGISARDRASTLRVLGCRTSRPEQLTRPGHVLIRLADPGGVVAVPGHAEAAVDLVGSAGLSPVAAMSRMVNDDGSLASVAQARAFADRHRLPCVSITDIVARRSAQARSVLRCGEASTQIQEIPSKVVTYRTVESGTDVWAFLIGALGEQVPVPADIPTPLMRIHRRCVPGEVLDARGCDCGGRLSTALTELVAGQNGVLIYMPTADTTPGITHVGAASAVCENTMRGAHCRSAGTRIAADVARDLGLGAVRLLVDLHACVDEERAMLAQHGVVVEELVDLDDLMSDATRTSRNADLFRHVGHAPSERWQAPRS